MKKLATSAAIVLSAGLLLAPATGAQAAAPADTARAANTKVEIGNTKVGATKVTITGSVSSKKGKCENGRKVKLRAETENKVVGADKTNGNGKWSITFKQSAAAPGDYTAFAPKTGGCKAGSDTEAIG